MPATETNYWLDERCARAFWDQHLAPPYQDLLRDTARWLEAEPGEHWLDLGCGAGHLTAALWQQTDGQLAEVVALDCSPANAGKVDKLRRHLITVPGPDRLRFTIGNFSDGLPQFADNRFDGVVSGLAISYAEWRDPTTGQYTDFAYNRLLAELYRVLKPGGQLVFSVNVPAPRFWRILWKSLRTAFRLSKPGKSLLNGLRMQGYGHWLRRQAQRGRFHFLPIEQIEARLRRVGFVGVRHRLSYAGQAYVVAAHKPRAGTVAESF
jgi:ubiquinone/menaquinone biosynthesis C-methylase UbiE